MFNSVLQVRRVVKPTPPTPVQSFQDLSILSTSPVEHAVSPPLHYTTSPPAVRHNISSPVHHNIPLSTPLSPPTSTESRGQPISGGVHEVKGEVKSGNSEELELKQSQFSPLHSKRSLSADTIKRFLLAQLDNGGGETGSRVISAGNERKERSRRLNSRVLEGKKGRGQRGETNGIDGQPPEMRKSSVDLPFWKSEIVPLLHDLEFTPYQKVEHLCTACSSLWTCLEGRGLLGRTGGVGGTKRRSAVLKTIFKLLDHKDPGLLLRVAKIIVAVSCNRVHEQLTAWHEDIHHILIPYMLS